MLKDARELLAGVGRSRLTTGEVAQRTLIEQGSSSRMVIQENKHQPEVEQQQQQQQQHDNHKNVVSGCKSTDEEDRKLETRCFDQIRENVVGNPEMEVEGRNMSPTPCEEDEGNTSPIFYMEDEGNMSPISYKALRIMSAKKRCFEDYLSAKEKMETDKAPAAEKEDEGNMTPTPYEGHSPASSSDSSNSNNYEPLTPNSIQSGVLINYKKRLTTLQVTPSRPVSSFVKDSSVAAFREFHYRVFKKMRGGIPLITVRLDSAVFGTDTDMELHLFMTDVQSMCYMEDFSVNCVMAYIRHLYDVLVKQEIEHKFEFINPASVSSAKDSDLSKLITSRLDKSTCEWVLIPVNPEGEGWLLAVIHMETMSCYWLDPSGRQCQSNFKHFVTLGLQSLQKDRVWKKSPIWHIVKCPTRKKNVECGFYVLRFMREIILEPQIFRRSKPFPKPTYEQDEIDEVRLEWIQTVEAYV